jgi:hypothetical protein
LAFAASIHLLYLWTVVALGVGKMDYPTADESSADKILQFLEYFASKGFREFEVATAASGGSAQVNERRSWEVSDPDDLATVAREMVLYSRLFPDELRRTLSAVS